MTQNRKVVIYCSSSCDIDEKYNDAAREVVRALASKGYSIVSGGGVRGTMGVISEEADKCSCRHIGVIPRFLEKYTSPCLSETIITETMSERKEKMREDTCLAIALPGGIGTLDELVETHVLIKLDRYKGKLILLNIDGFYEPYKNIIGHFECEKMLECVEDVLFVDSVSELVEQL